jgi:hypothetical protein
MKRSFWFRRIAGFILIAVAAILLFSFIVMSLWNNILTAVISVPAITFGQALGILVLSKILFGGFRGGGGWRGRGGRWGQEMKDKWQKMTPEEQEKFKYEWRSRCSRWGKPSNAAPGQESTEI